MNMLVIHVHLNMGWNLGPTKHSQENLKTQNIFSVLLSLTKTKTIKNSFR